ncbi:MAG: carbohydrate binding domain-containing protein [Candidatus Promineifilaceae bacterium]
MNRKHSLLLIVVLMIAILLSTQMASAVQPPIIFDDMEHGDPFNNGWFVFNGSVGGGGIGPNTTDLPPENGGAYSLETGWGSGGAPGYFGGFGRTSPTDLSGADHFNFWINPDAGQDYTLEINLQDDDNGDNNAVPADDDEFQFNCVVSATGPCAVSGDGWQLVSIPLADFFDDNSYFTGGNGVLDPVPTSAGGNGQLINVVFAVIGNSGSDATFRTDYWTFAEGSAVTPILIVDDFENGVAPGTSCVGIPLGFCTFAGASSVSIAAQTTPPAPLLPEIGEPNTVMQVDLNVTDYAGFIHGFTNASGDTWVPQDWSAYQGFGVWIYGRGDGTSLFIDLLENRNPGSTTDDAERWTVTISDDFVGWQKFEIPFSNFVRKDVGNGAPNDGFSGDEVHGWAFGTLGTGGPAVYYLDQAFIFGEAPERPLTVQFSTSRFQTVEGAPAQVTVELSRPLKEGDPDQVSVFYATEPGSAQPDRDFTPVSGTMTFVKDGPSEQSFAVPTIDNDKHDGDKTVILRLSDPVDIPLGVPAQSRIDILDDEEFDPTLLDDFERGAYLWDGYNVTLSTPEITAGSPLALPGQGAYEHILQVDTAVLVDVIVSGAICNSGNGVIPVAILTTDDFDALSIDHNTVRLGDAAETHRDKKTGEARRHEEDFDGDGDMDLVFHFRADETGYDCETTVLTLTGETFDGQPIISGGEAGFGRDFPIGQDWTRGEALSFWFYGTNSGDAITLQLKDNRAPDPGPSGWGLVWSDEFNEPAGTPPNPDHWTYEIGDGTANANPGWGNNELQYYTSSTANSATDGSGNLVITAREADGSQMCYYGPCEYTSARLISQYKAEFAYGRIESRILVPDGGAGLWPAYWSLGTNIPEVGWPQSGEIDFMEYVSRQPHEIFGTIHGPGYSGGASFGGVYTFAGPVSDSYHTFAVEWQPDLIEWYVDDILYHSATPADVAPNEWVFNDPFFVIFNMAVGGNFGGPVAEDTTFPQELTIDYLRVYQGPDTAERWEATFADNFEGWQQVVIPFASLTRSAEQPAGAPDDGLTLSDVWGYGFELPEGGTSSGTLRLDQVYLELIPPPTEITVTNLNNSGPGSLRQALADIAIGGTITFDPALAGGTLPLTSGPLVPGHSVTVDAAAAPGITLDGGGVDRVLIVDPGLDVSLAHLNVAHGYGWQLAGGILNNGNLTLDHVAVSGNVMATDAGDYWQGGGGIYSGEGATLYLVDSTVSDNTAGWSGGGVYSFFNTTTTIERSTISGNVSNDVGGGMRSLGNAQIINSTVSGNEATGWYGGALFVTDGIVHVINSTVADNISPAASLADIFVGTFTDASATLTLSNTVVSGDVNCFYAPWGAGTVTLTAGHNNVFTDDTCFPGASDQVMPDAGLLPLADNGGPTLTHALLPASPAVDTADGAICPATDQRGVARPQGAGCDAGSYELMP